MCHRICTVVRIKKQKHYIRHHAFFKNKISMHSFIFHRTKRVNLERTRFIIIVVIVVILIIIVGCVIIITVRIVY